MKTLTILSGYARAGKSTTVQHLVDVHNFYNASTSKVLGELTETVLKNMFGYELNTDDKNDFIELPEGGRMSSREAKIKMAEECIAPILTRTALMLGFKKGVESHENVVYEAFNIQEATQFLDLYAKEFDKINIWHVRSDAEQPDVDKRELIYGKRLNCTVNSCSMISNNGTISELYDRIDDLV